MLSEYPSMSAFKLVIAKIPKEERWNLLHQLNAHYLGCTESASPQMAADNNNTKEKAMCYSNKLDKDVNVTVDLNVSQQDIGLNADAQSKQHLSDRLFNITDEKVNALMAKFNLFEPEEPKDPKELVERIKAGKFQFNKRFVNEAGEYHKDDGWRGNAVGYITWYDPDKQPDKVGYEVASKAMYAARQKVQDAIAIKYPETALEALYEFETLQFA